MANTQTTAPGVADLQSFARAVLAATSNVGNGATERFGARKVFVSAVYARFTGGRPIADIAEFAAFAARLINANRAGLLQLARADLIGAMPFVAVAASEISDLNARFHFVIDPTAREPWEHAS